MKLYATRVDCEVAGTWRQAGTPFPLTNEQARELAPPFGNVVAPYTPPHTKEPTHGRFGRDKRRNRQAAD